MRSNISKKTTLYSKGPSKMKFRIFYPLLFLFVFCCTNDSENDDYPNCLDTYIDTALNQGPTTPRASIDKYDFDNKEVYLVSIQNFPDGMAIVVDEDCEIICEMGGIAGIICDGFNEAVFLESIWEDPR